MTAVVGSAGIRWSWSSGLRDIEAVGQPPGLDTQYRIGSLTKGFTSALILQCQDAGLLDLDDAVSEYLPLPLNRRITIRRLLTHQSGLPREAEGNHWERVGGPRTEDVLRLSERDLILRPGTAWHYSNLAYGVLGLLVESVRGATWFSALQERLLAPLGMTRTTARQQEPAAKGYFVDPYSGLAVQEPAMDLRSLAAAGQLWSTGHDLARWVRFLINGDNSLLSMRSFEQLRSPATLCDLDRWTLAYGLGMLFHRRGILSSLDTRVGCLASPPLFLFVKKQSARRWR